MSRAQVANFLEFADKENSLPSLYLGSIGGKTEIYEIHVLTKDLPFREYSSSQIADHKLFHDIVTERFNVLKNGKPIFCTAVNPIIEKGVEINPHDDRDGTIHFVCLNEGGKIVCCLSVAVDTQEKEHGEIIGLPLENRWKANGYPQ